MNNIPSNVIAIYHQINQLRLEICAITSLQNESPFPNEGEQALLEQLRKELLRLKSLIED